MYINIDAGGIGAGRLKLNPWVCTSKILGNKEYFFDEKDHWGDQEARRILL